MKKIFTLLCLVFIIAFSSLGQVSDNREPGQILVMLKPGANPAIDASLRSSLESKGITVENKVTKTFNIWLFTFNEKIQPANSTLERIKSHPAVQIAQFNHYVEDRGIPNDEGFIMQWALRNLGQAGGTIGADIHASDAWDITTGGVTALGDTIVIAIVDAGMDMNHPDLNFFKNYNEIPGNGIDDDNNGYIDDVSGWNAYSNNGSMIPSDHGTHVAGSAAARTNNSIGVAGVAYNAKLLPVAGSGSNEMLVVSSYDYVYTMRKLYNETNGQKGAYIVASNSSFGINSGNPANYPLWGAMYDSMGMVGIINVASTANVGWDVDVQGDIPTAMSNESLVTVTNTTNLDLRNSQAAWGATTIDLGAPGTNIYSTIQGGSYSYKSGTSMASPHVSGAVALLYSATDSARLAQYKELPSLAVSRFKRYLLATVDTIPSLVGLTVSGGRLNLRDAVTMAANYPRLLSNPPLVNIAIKPNSRDTITLQLQSTSIKPDPFSLLISPPVDWLSTNIQGGVFKPGVPETLNLYFNSAQLADGVYYTKVIMSDYFLEQYDILVEMKVDRTINTNDVTNNASVSANPNPFKESLQIGINLLQPSKVTVAVYNSLGIKIASLIEGKLLSGNQTIIWNGKDDFNQNMSSGVYFIVVTDTYGSKTIKTIKY